MRSSECLRNNTEDKRSKEVQALWYVRGGKTAQTAFSILADCMQGVQSLQGARVRLQEEAKHTF